MAPQFRRAEQHRQQVVLHHPFGLLRDPGGESFGELGVDREGLRQLVDSLRQKLGSGVVALGMPDNGKVALIAGVTKDLTAKVHAGKVIQTLAQQVGGRGGGRPDLAEGGGEDTKALNSTLGGVPALLEALL